MKRKKWLLDIEITGGIKKERELAEEIVWWCMDMLMPQHRVLSINFKFCKTFEDGAFGFCYRGDNDREFNIQIDHRLGRTENRKELIETIIHEMVHVWQGSTGRMKDMVRSGKQLWRCKDNKYRNYTNTKYEKQPWEVQAYKLQGTLTELFMKDYGYDDA